MKERYTIELTEKQLDVVIEALENEWKEHQRYWRGHGLQRRIIELKKLRNLQIL